MMAGQGSNLRLRLTAAQPANGDVENGLRLAACVGATRESLGISISIPFWDAILDRYFGPAREQLGVAADEVWAAGRELEFDDAVELALQGDEQRY